MKIQCLFRFQDDLRRNADKKQEVVLVKDDNKPVSHSGPQAGENEATPIQDMTPVYIKQEELGAFENQNEQEYEKISLLKCLILLNNLMTIFLTIILRLV